MEKYFVVRYEGPFGFIKPWTAVRDGGDPKTIHTYSQQFLTPSIIEGMENKLFPELLDEKFNGKIQKIKGHRLNYQGLDGQLEKAWSKGEISKRIENNTYRHRNPSIIVRGVMIKPHLYLAFENDFDANIAMTQTLCLCRNEDIVFPMEKMEISFNDFDAIDGFELIFSDDQNGFKVGHNRFNNAVEMYGELKVFGNPIRS